MLFPPCRRRALRHSFAALLPGALNALGSNCHPNLKPT
jgi:hypothetical protein